MSMGIWIDKQKEQTSKTEETKEEAEEEASC
jgi:hypothetical protein